MAVISAFVVSLAALQFASSSLVATEVIRAGDRISTSNTETESGNFTQEDEFFLGKEARRTVYVGQTIIEKNIRAPRIVTRNQAVTVRYVRGSLEITMTGRAMDDGAVGDVISVMNTESRELVSGTVTENGWILTQ